MIRHKTLQLIVTTVSFSVASIALAAPGDRFPIDLEQVEAKAAERFQSIDKNGDGEIDASEFESADIRRPRHPGREARRKHGHRPGMRDGALDRRDGMKTAVTAELFTLLDTDADGQLSREEHAGENREMKQLAHKRASFKRFDSNGDGVLLPEEIPGRGERLKAADADGDGQVTRDELRALRDKS